MVVQINFAPVKGLKSLYKLRLRSQNLMFKSSDSALAVYDITRLFYVNLFPFESIFGSFFCVYPAAVIFLFMIGSTTFLPGLTAICLGIIALVRKNDSHDRIMAIIAIALAGVALLFLFLVLCISMNTLVVF